MPMLEWNDSLSCHVADIDAQHKSLVDMVNKLHDAMRSGAAESALFSIIGEMRKYTVEHFDTEEKYMAEYSFQDAAAHKAEHKDFVDKVVKVEEGLKGGKVELSMDILNFLSNWLVTHIFDVDVKMGRYLASKGAS